MSAEQFFEKKGPYSLGEISKLIGCVNNLSNTKNFQIHSLKTLDIANKDDITFLNSSKYKELSLRWTGRESVIMWLTSNQISFEVISYDHLADEKKALSDYLAEER